MKKLLLKIERSEIPPFFYNNCFQFRGGRSMCSPSGGAYDINKPCDCLSFRFASLVSGKLSEGSINFSNALLTVHIFKRCNIPVLSSFEVMK